MFNILYMLCFLVDSELHNKTQLQLDLYGTDISGFASQKMCVVGLYIGFVENRTNTAYQKYFP